MSYTKSVFNSMINSQSNFKNPLPSSHSLLSYTFSTGLSITIISPPVFWSDLLSHHCPKNPVRAE
ncbi:hypothetical protein N44_01832 [Microcystis aeruginosa NIES-44]|uniref:Uncharacterized protein n=1 Tax=Microcystis aeruginosa NIES-44 TaxID=449439 RepID=A0A0A1VTT8_MICAE|nr:hypothetical protein N44_01832 [Microcystis aeruginosa NIES-44]